MGLSISERITPDNAANLFKLIGCKCNVVATGHPDYHRGFVISPEGTSLGRVVIFKGKYQWVKWYFSQYSETDFNDSDFIIYAWRLLIDEGHLLTRREFDACCVAAMRACNAELNERKKWRTDNPHPKNKQRRALQRKNPRGFLDFSHLGVNINVGDYL